MTATGIEMVDAALSLARRGWHVFAVDHPAEPVCVGIRTRAHDPATCPPAKRGKHPCGAWSVHATTDPTAIVGTFGGPPRNIGIACGPSGLLVIDEDDTGAFARFAASIGQTLPVTYIVITRIGRRHFYFLAPPGITLGNGEGALAGSGCNVRGDGGYVVGPGSLHTTGVVYTAVDPSIPPAECPDWLIAALTAKSPPTTTTPTHSGDPAGGGMIPYRHRYTTLLKYAGSLRERMSYAEAVVLFHARWLDCVQPPGQIPEAHYHAPPPPDMPAPVATWDSARTTIFDDVWGRYPSRSEKDAAGWAAMGLDMATFRQKGTGNANGNGGRPVDPRLVGALPNLPEQFWSARSVLSHIRRAAHSRGRSADLVLGAVLAKLSAMVDPALQFDTGLGGGSLNLGVVAIGVSASGKSSGVSLARGLLPTPGYLRAQLGEEARFLDGVPLGSGEGIAEAYMGSQQVPTGETTKSGTPKMKEIRVQVRRNVFFYVDEGEALTKMGARSGNTTTAALRSALTGATLGAMNARADTSRVIAAGAYSLGLVLGYQPDSAQELLAEAPLGTPQRFVWVSATDPAVPDVAPGHPGALSVELADPAARLPTGAEAPLTGVITAAEEIRAEVWARNLARARGQTTDGDPLDAHELFVRSKVAALLALLDGRRDIGADDWALAAVMWATSCAVRERVVAHGRGLAAAKAEAATEASVDRAVRTAAEVTQVTPTLARIAALLAAKVGEHGAMTHGAAHRRLAGRDRGLYRAAVEHGVTTGLLAHSADGITAGTVRTG